MQAKIEMTHKKISKSLTYMDEETDRTERKSSPRESSLWSLILKNSKTRLK